MPLCGQTKGDTEMEITRKNQQQSEIETKKREGEKERIKYMKIKELYGKLPLKYIYII